MLLFIPQFNFFSFRISVLYIFPSYSYEHKIYLFIYMKKKSIFTDAVYKKGFHVACRTYNQIRCVDTDCEKWNYRRILWRLEWRTKVSSMFSYFFFVLDYCLRYHWRLLDACVGLSISSSKNLIYFKSA